MKCVQYKEKKQINRTSHVSRFSTEKQWYVERTIECSKIRIFLHYFDLKNDLKYLFAYTVPLAALVSVSGNGIVAFTAPIYVFIFIPLLEAILADYDTHYTEEEQVNRKFNRFFDLMLYLNIPLYLPYCFWLFSIVAHEQLHYCRIFWHYIVLRYFIGHQCH